MHEPNDRFSAAEKGKEKEYETASLLLGVYFPLFFFFPIVFFSLEKLSPLVTDSICVVGWLAGCLLGPAVSSNNSVLLYSYMMTRVDGNIEVFGDRFSMCGGGGPRIQPRPSWE